ncbi:hypothetical protein D5086_013363 [Populus alba]|uniref:Uncharacterized protein n=1 Tax=Populus alba TaxID=43335 RepID=A0ACC4C5X9_POPAL
MKASLKFREEQNPLFRAKVPLSIVGLPFQSGIIAGESKELSLNLSTFFESGPSFKFSYRPNDTWNPFSLVIKTGTGPFGSPVSSSMIMSAEFNLLGKDGTTLHVIVFEPSQETTQIKSNAIVLVHPYSKMGGSRTLVHGIASRLSIKGFTAITFDMRSVGRSTGAFLMVLLKFRCRLFALGSLKSCQQTRF